MVFHIKRNLGYTSTKVVVGSIQNVELIWLRAFLNFLVFFLGELEYKKKEKIKKNMKRRNRSRITRGRRR